MQSPDRERLDTIAELVAQLLRGNDDLERRLARLEGAVFPAEISSKSRPVESPPSAPAVLAEPKLSVLAPEPVLPPPSVNPADGGSENTPVRKKPALETKLGLTIVNRVGVITLVLGVAFFFKWAVDNNWIGPSGRVILGVLAGFAVLGIGDLLWRKGQQIFAQGITGTGVAVLYLSFYAAFGFYHLIGQAFAFLLMLAVTGMAVALSLRYGAQTIASLGLLGGFLTPLLLSTGEDHPWFLFSYLLVLDAAAVLLLNKCKWRVPEVLSFSATVLIYGAWLADHTGVKSDRLVATLALLAFFALYANVSSNVQGMVAQLLAAIAVALIWRQEPAGFFPIALAVALGGLASGERRRSPLTLSIAFAAFWVSYGLWDLSGNSFASPWLQFGGITVAFLLFSGWQIWKIAGTRQDVTAQRLATLTIGGAVYYGAAYSLLSEQYRAYLGLLAVVVAGIYFAFGTYLYRQTKIGQKDLRPVAVSLASALCFVTLAIPVQFTGFTITVAWSLQAAVLSWLGWRFRESRATVGAGIVFAFVAIRLLCFDAFLLSNARAYALLFNVRFLTFAVAAASLVVSSRWASHTSRKAALIEYFGGHLVLLWGLTLEVIGWAERSSPPQNVLSVETAATSILFGIYALLLVGVGVGTRTAINRIGGLCLLGLVILKLYLFDVWQLNRVYRITAFVILGVLLIATSFLYSRFRLLIESWWKDDQTTQ